MSLRAEAVRKRFEDRTILAGASLALERGEVVALTGANGSGKTTFARILATLLPPDDGEILFDDVPVGERRVAARRAIGFISHQALLYAALTPLENLEFFGRLSGTVDARAKAGALLAGFGLSPFADMPIAHFSRGMLQRVALCRALLNEPRFLILDEPYAGLDAQGITEFERLLSEAIARGAAALLVGHDSERATPLATRSLRMDRGRLEAA